MTPDQGFHEFVDRYTVRAAGAQDRDAWLEMWHGYCDFYQAHVPAAVTEATWDRILSPASTVYALVAVNERTGDVVGFANCVVHPYTWSELPACYLEDLFVRPEARGSGAGAALLAHLVALAGARKWARVYWMTRGDNRAARRLYERFCSHDDFIRYVLTVDP